jgi:WD40 repeat protein
MWSGSDALFDHPVVSPDGKQVVWEGWGDELGVAEIRISQFTISTGAPRKVLFHNKDYMGTEPFGWSRDGKEIFAILERQDRTSVIVAVSTSNGSLRILKSLQWRAPEKLSLSPDGSYIVYDTPVSGNSTNRDIFLLATNGSGEIPVVQDPSRDTSPVWTPAGHAMALSTTARVRRIALRIFSRLKSIWREEPFCVLRRGPSRYLRAITPFQHYRRTEATWRTFLKEASAAGLFR